MLVGCINKVVVLTGLPDKTFTSQFYVVVRQGSTVINNTYAWHQESEIYKHGTERSCDITDTYSCSLQISPTSLSRSAKILGDLKPCPAQ